MTKTEHRETDMTTSYLDELMRYAGYDDAGSRLSAAAIILGRCGDHEMAETMRILSAQMDFDDNEEACEAIERTRAKLDTMIAERCAHHSMLYLGKLRDEEVIELSNGKVFGVDIDELASSFVKGGLFDPDIFGGSGRIPYFNDKTLESPCQSFGYGIGHIELPVRCVLQSDYAIIANLLDITPEDVNNVVKYRRMLVMEPGGSPFEKHAVISEKEYMKHRDCTGFTALTGGEAIYEALCALGYGDHPERMAFRILPVISPKARPLSYSKKEKMYYSHPMNDGYNDIVYASNRLRNIIGMHAPEVIWRNEARILDDKVNKLAEIAKESTCPDYMPRRGSQLYCFVNIQFELVRRKRNMCVRRLTKEELNKTGDIVSLGVYPDNICLLDDSGSSSMIAFRQVIEADWDAVNDYRNKNAFIEPMGGETATDEESCAHVQSKCDTMEQHITDILADAAEHGTACTVRFDTETGMYVLAND